MEARQVFVPTGGVPQGDPRWNTQLDDQRLERVPVTIRPPRGPAAHSPHKYQHNGTNASCVQCGGTENEPAHHIPRRPDRINWSKHFAR